MRLFDQASLVEAARLHYRQPHRGYHNQEHLDELMRLARQHTPDLGEAEQLALLFHDAVYVPGAARGDNERLSALLMRATVATLGVQGLDLAGASRIIKATTHAEAPSAEAARVCDLDLWRLAAPWDEFERHALGIRHEYLHLHADEAAFWTARNAFYKSMLAKPALFATDYFRDNFEAAARKNLTRALAQSTS
ncbi:MAG: metal-dependent phosphohydrolase [Reyranellales bacterium]